MTYSILARDPETGTIGGVATTGSYCVGGWVLRGDVKIGMSASQGASASTILGDQMLAQMNGGETPDSIIQAIQEKDQGPGCIEMDLHPGILHPLGNDFICLLVLFSKRKSGDSG